MNDSRFLEAGVDGQQQVGAARRHVAAVRRLHGGQHAQPAKQHVRPNGRVGFAQRPVPPADGRPRRGPVARHVVTLVAGAVADAAVAAPGRLAAMDRGRQGPSRGRPSVVLRRFPG